jgi:hypothetical protein
MNLKFQFSLKRLLVSTGLLCLSLSLFSLAMNGPVPLLFFYFATIVLGVAGTNLVGRPLTGAVGVLLFWTGFMLISAAFNASLFTVWELLAGVVVVAAFLAGMATQRHLDQRRRKSTAAAGFSGAKTPPPESAR